MKYLIWLLVILLGLWVWRRAGQARRPRPPATPPAEKAPDAMCSCAHCGVHLPLNEAVRGERGLYCSTGHRSAAADRNPR
jgi:uncharacterized protein